MTKYDLGTRLFFSDKNYLRSTSRLLGFADLFVQRGYYIDVDPDAFDRWYDSLQPGGTPLLPCVSDPLQQAIEEFANHQRKGLEITFYPVRPPDDDDDPISFYLEINSHDDYQLNTLWFYTGSQYYNNQEDDPEWLAYVQELYDYWHPYYQAFDMNGAEIDDVEEVEQGHIVYLMASYNYFGPALATQLGRERLLATPGVKIRQLADGGIYLGKGKTKQAAAYLGMQVSPSFYWGQ